MNVAVLGVNRRIFVNGVHVASMLPMPYERPLPADYHEGGPRFVPATAYGIDREEILIDAYQSHYAQRPIPKWSLDQWREWWNRDDMDSRPLEYQ